MVFKREKNYMLQKDPPFDVPTSLNMIDTAKTQHGHSKKLYTLIKKNQNIHSNEKLDIAHGSMASQTAEGFYLTLKKEYIFLRICTFLLKFLSSALLQIAEMYLWTFNIRSSR